MRYAPKAEKGKKEKLKVTVKKFVLDASKGVKSSNDQSLCIHFNYINYVMIYIDIAS